MKNKNTKGFTLIELLVVIAILGVLMGLIGPKVFDLLSGSKGTKTQAIFKSWVTQLYQYKEYYKYFPPFLLENEEGDPLLLTDDESHAAFIAALKGMQWDVGSQSWSKLDDDMLRENKKSRQFHSFTEDEFGEDGYLADAWGGRNIQIVVDQNGDGLIELSSEVVNEIKEALKSDYDSEIVEEAAEKFKVIRDKVGIFVLEDKSGEFDSENVFSWDIQKFLAE
jgi:prepilin-type N-terminal cleavage/methylation domain-containing protein|tara:strand:- start:278 stop:946 length:669 start_codon:yes stop_codon:yes gene_type:complete